MKQTLTNIKASIILQALRKAAPITAVGRAAVENYRAYLTKNAMTAIALENSIVSLTGPQYDAGCEGLIATLKGIMPEANRRVAVAYELLMQEPKNFFSAGNSALEALDNLYDMSATKIIDEINGGALDAFKTSPVVLKLIAWAKAATKAAPERAIPTGEGSVAMTLVPVLNIASAGDDKLVAIDGRAFLLGSRGKLTYIPNLADMEQVTDEIRALVETLSYLTVSTTEPNILLVKDDALEFIKKALPIKSLGIDLMGGIDEMVQINGNAMSTDKAMALIKEGSSDIVANALLNEGATEAIALVSRIMQLFERYRTYVYSNMYANKFVYGNITEYMLAVDGRLSTVTILDGNVFGTEVFDSAFDALASEIFVTNPALHSAVSQAFSNDLKADMQKMSVRQKLAQKLSDERQQYEALLNRINSELSDLEDVVDANPEKVSALNDLKKKTEEAIAKTVEEIDKLAKTKA